MNQKDQLGEVRNWLEVGKGKGVSKAVGEGGRRRADG